MISIPLIFIIHFGSGSVFSLFRCPLKSLHWYSLIVGRMCERTRRILYELCIMNAFTEWNYNFRDRNRLLLWPERFVFVFVFFSSSSRRFVRVRDVCTYFLHAHFVASTSPSPRCHQLHCAQCMRHANTNGNESDNIFAVCGAMHKTASDAIYTFMRWMQREKHVSNAAEIKHFHAYRLIACNWHPAATAAARPFIISVQQWIYRRVKWRPEWFIRSSFLPKIEGTRSVSPSYAFCHRCLFARVINLSWEIRFWAISSAKQFSGDEKRIYHKSPIFRWIN